MSMQSDYRKLSPEAKARVDEALATAKALAAFGASNVNPGLVRDIDAVFHPPKRICRRLNGPVVVRKEQDR